MDSLLKNATQCKEYVGPGIQRVYAARLSEDGAPILLLCRADGSYAQMQGNRITIREERSVQWQTLETLANAAYTDLSWMQVRNKLAL